MSEILDGIGSLLAASMNEAVDNAEEPSAMLAQMLREYATVIESARQAHAHALAQVQQANDEASAARTEAAGWGVKAKAAAQRAVTLEAAGSAQDGARFDDLARRALRQQVSDEALGKRLEDTAAVQTQYADQLKEGLNGMRAKLLELQAKRAEMVAQASMVEARQQIAASLADFEAMDARNDLDNGRLDLLGTDTEAEVETRLAELKNPGGVLAASGY